MRWIIILCCVAVGVGLIVSQRPGGHVAHTEATAVPAGITLPELLGDAAKGSEVFAANCVTCHGPYATGTESGPPLVHVIYEPNHHGDGAFYAAVQNGVRQHHWRFGDMPPVQGVSEGETALVIAYIRTLQRANGIN